MLKGITNKEIAPSVLMGLREFIDNTRWVFAKTYAKTAPHEYAVLLNIPTRNVGAYKEFAKAIGKYGSEEFFWGNRVIYLYIDNWKYWTYPDIELINRAKV